MSATLPVADAREPLELLLRDLKADRNGLTSREVERRLIAFGRNELVRRTGRRWPRELRAQFTHPLALLLWVAAGLAFLAGTPWLAVAIVAVILLNALFAFIQERQAERAVEALAGYLPSQAVVIRDGRHLQVAAAELVPGDVVMLSEETVSRPTPVCSKAGSRSTFPR